ncbi:CHASE domain-containing protein [Pacificimonas flava]|uniref:histidine kinase n=1 Tax=Pacificimonas flava TaxID=1234595 RepID=M2SF03_9SPHN|nr:CHASE domain-containing protein [Pacificimonas flava]EMD83925.1 Signal transduction histidine kinase [Pacificimonas flava]MBB5281102.1 CHASE1-domain containing sensor protein [Pacificimonas flava]
MPRLAPTIIAIFVAVAGFVAAWFLYHAEEDAARSRFQMQASEVSDRIDLRMKEHLTLLAAARGLFTSTDDEITRAEFRAFVAALDTEDVYKGIQGIGFARLIPATQVGESRIEADLAAHYGIRRTVWPATDADRRTVITLLEPNDERNNAALGYDMMSQPVRRAAILDALASGAPQASGPVELVQEITSRKQTGFLIYLPVYQGTGTPFSLDPSGEALGFVYAPFRAGDLFSAALGDAADAPVRVTAVDVVAPSIPLYESTLRTQRSGFRTQTVIDVAGRRWRLTLEQTPFATRSKAGLYASAVVTLTLILAFALWLLTWSLMRSAAQNRELASLSARRAEEKDFLLREMSHRVKNSIARIVAIADQTVRSSPDLATFEQSFSARLQAMAAAQDTLTRANMQGAPLRKLLLRELEQVFGTGGADLLVDGPDVVINEKATQALGLIFHELATNTLKYGNHAEGFYVSWRIEEDTEPRLCLDWVEGKTAIAAPPARRGFGTRLIDMSVRAELRGTLERSYDQGFSVRMCFPLHLNTELPDASGGNPVPAA